VVIRALFYFFDPRKFSIHIWSEGNTLRFEANWPVAFPYLVLALAAFLTGFFLLPHA
jgi:hypothetical protein